MNYSDLNTEIHRQMERINWGAERLRLHLRRVYGKGVLTLLTNEQMTQVLEHLRSQSTQSQLQVTIPAGLFDQLERYLQAQAANRDSEASRLLIELDDLEIDRNVKEYITKQERGSC